jgi:hypothetical protein
MLANDRQSVVAELQGGFGSGHGRYSRSFISIRQDDVAPIRFASGTDGEAVIIGAVRAVRRLSDASWPSCRNPTVHIQGAIEQAEVGPAAADQVCMARDVAIMFDELKALADRHAEVQADRARLQAELERERERERERAVALVASMDKTLV